MRKTRKVLVLALLYDAMAVFAMQVCRWTYAWCFVALYWALLTALNFCNWLNEERSEKSANKDS